MSRPTNKRTNDTTSEEVNRLGLPTIMAITVKGGRLELLVRQKVDKPRKGRVKEGRLPRGADA
eukprot:196644-Prorocentrum_minimum.AAC.2